MTPFMAELIGTALLLLLGDGVVANVLLKDTKGHDSGWIVITTAWALAVYVGVVVAGPYSGAHLNPAVTIGLAMGGTFPWADVPSYIAAQMIGGALGVFFVWLMYKQHFDRTEEPRNLLQPFCTDPEIHSHGINLISEIIGTFVLVYGVFFIAGPDLNIGGEDAKVGLGSIGAIPVAFIVWVIGLSLGGTTGYAINPARDLSPRIMHAILPIKHKGSSRWDYSWVPVIGPIVGALLAAGLFLAFPA